MPISNKSRHQVVLLACPEECVCVCVLPARMALCAWNSWPATQSEQSVKRECSHKPPSSSASLQSGTFTMFIVFCPEMFTESCTTLTCTQTHTKKQNKTLVNKSINNSQ